MKKKTENIIEKTIVQSEAKQVQKPKKTPAVQKKLHKKSQEMNPMQEKAVKNLAKKVGKGGKVVLKEVLLESGYSPNTAETPQKVFGKPPVVRALKRLKLTPEHLQQAHEDLFNSETIEVLKYPMSVPPEDIIALIQSRMKGAQCAKHFVVPEMGMRIYEFIMPDRGMKKSMLELAYKFFPPKPQAEDPRILEKTKAKQNMILEESKNRLLLKKKLKLGNSQS